MKRENAMQKFLESNPESLSLQAKSISAQQVTFYCAYPTRSFLTSQFQPHFQSELGSFVMSSLANMLVVNLTLFAKTVLWVI